MGDNFGNGFPQHSSLYNDKQNEILLNEQGKQQAQENNPDLWKDAMIRDEAIFNTILKRKD